MLGNAVLAGQFWRQEGTGFKTNTEQEWPGTGTKQALGGCSCKEPWEAEEDGSNRCLCDLFKTLGIWCGGLRGDSGCLTLGDLQVSVVTKQGLCAVWDQSSVTSALARGTYRYTGAHKSVTRTTGLSQQVLLTIHHSRRSGGPSSRTTRGLGEAA